MSNIRPSLPPSRVLAWEEFRRLVSHETERLPIVFNEVEDEKPESERLLCYALDLGRELSGRELILRFYSREKQTGGRLGPFKPVSLKRYLDLSFSDGSDRELYEDLRQKLDGFVQMKARSQASQLRTAAAREAMQGFILPPPIALKVLSQLDAAGRLYSLPPDSKKPDLKPLRVMSQAWSAEAELTAHESGAYRLEVYLSSGEHRKDPQEVRLLAGGLFLLDGATLHPTNLNETQVRDWIERLSEGPAVLVARAELDRFIGEYAQIPSAPPMRWPEETAWSEVLEPPQPKLRLTPGFAPFEWMGELVFQYQRGEVNIVDARSRWIDPAAKRIYLRDFQREEELIVQLLEHHGVLRTAAPDMLEVGRIVRVVLKFLPQLVESLEAQGWQIEVENRRLQVLRQFETVVEGSKDWLDLSIATTVDDQTYQLPSLLLKKKAGSPFIPIGSGFALLPETWMKRMDLLNQAGEVRFDRIRIKTAQALLLDSLLADLPFEDRSCQLLALREKIKRFETLSPCDAPSGFQGVLRDYQREGLAWLAFLRDFGFGGCLADDMGLGKTVQVLALLQAFYQEGSALPSLVVVPRSLVGNWLEEAERFCPDLKLADFSQSGRNWSQLGEVQVILITYGTLRLDIEKLRLLKFAYVILDESQSIKNAQSQTAKAAYLLRAQHRLALSGTPIENHLGELGSLLQFLNPGLVDHGPWTEILQKKHDRNPMDSHLRLLQRALRPLILRRTKVQVLKDLPPKIEATIFCELEGEQRRLYDELHEHYRATLLSKDGSDRSKNSPLALIEALLRLRQAACHPALISPSYDQIPSAKLEILLDKLRELRASGHKALIFSQFTSFLKLVAKSLDLGEMPYEYLDGQTRDRSARVARFQSDPQIPFFLISLKAGGMGLNLTAADYCFILDPWWNPAVEAQAVDRAHRIHQTKTVFAYRLIARDTVEEKILELQKEKKDIAASLLEADTGLLESLDLRALQSLLA